MVASTPVLVSPNTANLMLGKGFCLLQPVGDPAFYHVGNVPQLQITPKSTPLDHYTAMQRQLVRDLRVVVQADIELKMSLEEITDKNLALLMSGNVDYTTPAQPVVNVMSTTSITGHFKFYATNDVGPRWYIDFPSIIFLATGTFDPISEKFNSVEVTGSVNFSNGIWGTMQLQPVIGTVAPENVLAPFISYTSLAHPSLLTLQLGGWIGAASFAYQWKRGATPISGATGPTYTTTVTDVGNVSCQVTATNSIGNTVVTTAVVAVT